MSEDRASQGVGLNRERGYRDEGLLRRLYVDEMRSMTEIADLMDCSPTTVRNWLEKYDVNIRTRGDAIRVAYGQHPNEVPLSIHSKGYERWNHSHKSEQKHSVFVHRLLAVAEYGFDAVSENVVHHINGIQWDNRPGNIELMEHGEHSSHHRKLSWVERLAVAEQYREGASTYVLSDIWDLPPPTVRHNIKDIVPNGLRDKSEAWEARS